MLIYRDVLPEYLVGEPPDWKRMVNKPETRPTRWLIAVDEGGEKNRVVGQAFNEIQKYTPSIAPNTNETDVL